jgi:Flp pilus assembly protein TadB
MNGVGMSPHLKWGIAGIVIGLILFIISPWVAIAVIAAAIAIPAVAWRMLDESQRRRYRQIRRRQREIR